MFRLLVCVVLAVSVFAAVASSQAVDQKKKLRSPKNGAAQSRTRRR